MVTLRVLRVQLEAFLSQRQCELSLATDVLSSSQFQAAPASPQLHTKQVAPMLEAVRAVLAQITSSKMQDLLLIRSSPRSVYKHKLSLSTLG